MTEIKVYNAVNKLTELEKIEVVDFLFHHLEDYGDPKAHIKNAIDFSIKDSASFGGFTLVMTQGGKILGVVVVNRTGMSGYIPENILVYIATHKEHRGEGVGKKLMNEAIQHAEGDIALHVEADNPAKHLYEKLGFTNPYLEMRLKK